MIKLLTMTMIAALSVIGCTLFAKHVSAQPEKCCELHGDRLELGTVPIIYGLLRPHCDECRDAERQQFPCANTYVSGGCMVGEKKRTEVPFCPTCREAREAWHQRHGLNR